MRAFFSHVRMCASGKCMVFVCCDVSHFDMNLTSHSLMVLVHCRALMMWFKTLFVVVSFWWRNWAKLNEPVIIIIILHIIVYCALCIWSLQRNTKSIDMWCDVSANERVYNFVYIDVMFLLFRLISSHSKLCLLSKISVLRIYIYI